MHLRLKLPAGPFRAYVFDCDGTIVDSMPLHYIAWRKALDEWNCNFDEELFYEWGGKPAEKIIADLNVLHGLAMPVAEVAVRKEQLYYDLLHALQPIPQVIEHIQEMHGKIPFAVVSGSRRASITHSLTALNLLDKFDTIVGAEDYAHPKPAPDGYLLAAQRLGVAPKDCLVFEDTALGIAAAKAAGMATVRVPSPKERKQVAKAGTGL